MTRRYLDGFSLFSLKASPPPSASCCSRFKRAFTKEKASLNEQHLFFYHAMTKFQKNLEEAAAAAPNYMYECQYSHAESEMRRKAEQFMPGPPKQVEINGEEVKNLVAPLTKGFGLYKSLRTRVSSNSLGLNSLRSNSLRIKSFRSNSLIEPKKISLLKFAIKQLVLKKLPLKLIA